MPRIELTDMDLALIDAVTAANQSKAQALQGLRHNMKQITAQAQGLEAQIEDRYQHMILMLGRAHDTEIPEGYVFDAQSKTISWNEAAEAPPAPEDDVEDAEELRERLSDAAL